MNHDTPHRLSQSETPTASPEKRDYLKELETKTGLDALRILQKKGLNEKDTTNPWFMKVSAAPDIEKRTGADVLREFAREFFTTKIVDLAGKPITLRPDDEAQLLQRLANPDIDKKNLREFIQSLRTKAVTIDHVKPEKKVDVVETLQKKQTNVQHDTRTVIITGRGNELHTVTIPKLAGYEESPDSIFAPDHVATSVSDSKVDLANPTAHEEA